MVPGLEASCATPNSYLANQNTAYHTTPYTSPTNHINPFVGQSKLSPTSGSQSASSPMHQSNSIGSKITQMIYGQGYLANYRAMLTGSSSSKTQLNASYSQQNVVVYAPTTPPSSLQNAVGTANHSHAYLQMDCVANQAAHPAVNQTNQIAQLHQMNATNQLNATHPLNQANQINMTNQINPTNQANHHTNHLNQANPLTQTNHPNGHNYFTGQSFTNMNSLIRSLCSPVRQQQPLACGLQSGASKSSSLVSELTNNLANNLADNRRISSMNQTNLLSLNGRQSVQSANEANYLNPANYQYLN